MVDSRKNKRVPGWLGAALAMSLAACAPDRVVTGSTYSYDYRERHPIVLAEAPRSLDLFANQAVGLDPRQREDLAAFAAEYRRHGEGLVVAQVPTGGPSRAAVRKAMGVVHRVLADSGIPPGRVSVTSYEAVDPSIAAPIRLVFRRMQAKVASRCGLWPQDLGESDPGFNARNEPYWNLGCAMQSNIASQIADPVDLVRGRAEGRVDTIRRANSIEKLRQGEDPSTRYLNKGDTINSAVGH